MTQSQLAGRRAEKPFGMLREAELGGRTAGFRWGPPEKRLAPQICAITRLGANHRKALSFLSLARQ